MRPVLRSQCLESSHAHSTAERTGRSRCALQASRQPCAPSRHRSRRHSASPHARMRRWRGRRAKSAKSLRDQPPPLDSRFAGRALVRQVGEQSTAGAPQAGQSGCHRLRGDGHIRRGAAGCSSTKHKQTLMETGGRAFNETTNYHVIRDPAGMARGARELSLAWKPAGSRT